VATSIPYCNYLCAPYYNSMNTHETYIKFRVGDDLKAEMKKAANAKGIDLSGWLRMIAIAAIYEAENERGKGSE
jgi:uncharacterized protein (DUF1778 family)